MRDARGLRLVLLALLATAGTAPAQDEDLDWIDWARLADGEVLYQASNADERGTATIRLAIEIDAPWEAIWELITACEISPEFVPHIVACSRIESTADGDSELFKQTVKPAFFLPRFDHVFQLDYFPPERVEVSHISGPIDRLEGTWRLIERPTGRIALVHKMTVNPAFPVPRFFVRNTLERDLPDVVEEIRRRAEAGSPDTVGAEAGSPDTVGAEASSPEAVAAEATGSEANGTQADAAGADGTEAIGTRANGDN